MNQILAVVLIVIAFVVLAYFFVRRFHTEADVTIDKNGLRAKGKNRESAVIENSTSRTGGARAYDSTGGGARISGTQVEKDLDAYSGPVDLPKD